MDQQFISHNWPLFAIRGIVRTSLFIKVANGGKCFCVKHTKSLKCMKWLVKSPACHFWDRVRPLLCWSWNSCCLPIVCRNVLVAVHILWVGFQLLFKTPGCRLHKTSYTCIVLPPFWLNSNVGVSQSSHHIIWFTEPIWQHVLLGGALF